jgi:hypothetical protein
LIAASLFQGTPDQTYLESFDFLIKVNPFREIQGLKSRSLVDERLISREKLRLS